MAVRMCSVCCVPTRGHSYWSAVSAVSLHVDTPTGQQCLLCPHTWTLLLFSSVCCVPTRGHSYWSCDRAWCTSVSCHLTVGVLMFIKVKYVHFLELINSHTHRRMHAHTRTHTHTCSLFFYMLCTHSVSNTGSAISFGSCLVLL